MPTTILNTISRLSMLAFSLFLLVAFTFTSAEAQESASDAVVTDFLNVFNTTTGKVAQLADAIPIENYEWRPAEGVRSIREAVLHIASGNYFFASILGAEIPEGIDPRGMEQSGMNKEEAIAALNESVDFVRELLNNMTEEDFNAKVDFFGNEITKRQAVFILGDHASEHLGQLIAYARSNGVTPPWSQQSE